MNKRQEYKMAALSGHYFNLDYMKTKSYEELEIIFKRVAIHCGMIADEMIKEDELREKK